MISEQCKQKIETPAFIFAEDKFEKLLSEASTICTNAGIKLLFPLKPLAVVAVLKYIRQYVDGFSASSQFEAQLADDIKTPQQTIHFTSPGAINDIKVISEYCRYISCNSLSQLETFLQHTPQNSCGLRINPQMSFVKDERFDPCCRHSKLGVNINQLSTFSTDELKKLKTKISGIHFHSNSESESFLPLLKTVEKICSTIPELMKGIDWINLGGGYFYDINSKNEQYLQQIVNLIRQYGCNNIFVEPGTALCADAGYLMTTVIDLFDSEGKTIAVLDTTVNHTPEVLEFNYSPELAEASDDGKYNYNLAGCSCLAGDIFGEYTFDEPLQLGSKLTFINTASYSIVKAHMFNGINLPALYWYNKQNQQIDLIKKYNYNDYLSRLE